MKRLILIFAILLNIACIAQEDKTVTLTVSGTGKTLEEAKTNALRSAIEQAFGAFISSKTEILNDNFVKDEIVSVTSGNIQKYDIVSQVEVLDKGYFISLRTTVSISKLTSFAESKGVIVEFKGGIFAQNIKLQKINEDSEVYAILNLTKTSFQLLNNSIDFELKVSEPTLQSNSLVYYNIDFSVYTKKNSNYEIFVKYFSKTLSSLFLNKEEIENMKKLNKPVYCIIIDEKINYLRSENSIRLLVNFFSNSQILTNSFKIYSNLENVKYSYGDLYKNIFTYSKIKYRNPEREARQTDSNFINYPFIFDALYVEMTEEELVNQINNNYREWLNNSYYLVEFFHKNIAQKQITVQNLLNINYNTNSFGILEKPLYINLTFKNPILTFVKSFELSEIEKINEFKIVKLNIDDFLKNSDLYVLPTPKYDD
jgi:hypothetical protein